MFGKKKEDRPKRDHKDRNLAQYGLFDMPSNMSFDDAGSDDDDLEAELLALTTGGAPRKKPKPKAVPVVNLDSMVAESMKDIASDEELSGDDDDPELLNELSLIAQDGNDEEEEKTETPKPELELSQILEIRLEMYLLAEKNAKTAGESTRARRFNRGAKTLKDLIKQVNAGKAINPDDIPPEVSTGDHKKPEMKPENNLPSRPAPGIPQTVPENPEPVSENPEPASENLDQSAKKEEVIAMLKTRRDEYKMAAVRAKKAGDAQTAINFMKIGKQFDIVVKAVEEDKEVDLSNMPGSPTYILPSTSTNVDSKTEENETQNENNEPELINPGNMLDGLSQRLGVYKAQEQTAKEEGNSSKARRMGRIVKQYEQAIKAHKSGKTVPLDELPNPPGFVPLIPPAPTPSEDKVAHNEGPEKPESNPPSEKNTDNVPVVPPRSNSVRKMGNQSSTTHNQRQATILLARQKEFKEAALEAKKKGEIAQAKEYLRTAKGFDRVIEASRCGLPVDMESLPIPPNARTRLEDSFDFVVADECTEDETGTLDMLARLEDQLTKQLKMCLSTRDHHKALGDVAGTNRFEHLALTVTKDLDIVRLAHRTNSREIPKFHYENKSFSVVKCCTDLNDNDFELNIARGINFNCTNPKEIDTYVKFEFPYPQEEPVKDKTSVVKDTNNPEYCATFTLPILRTSRPCLRVFKRQAVKLEVYSRGGFFRGDTLIGTVNIKLQPLETQCELHDSYDLMDGRKKVGGKLEVRMRVRNPLVAKQIEQLNEKWLIIDH